MCSCSTEEPEEYHCHHPYHRRLHQASLMMHRTGSTNKNRTSKSLVVRRGAASSLQVNAICSKFNTVATAYVSRVQYLERKKHRLQTQSLIPKANAATAQTLMCIVCVPAEVKLRATLASSESTVLLQEQYQQPHVYEKDQNCS